MTDEHIKLYIEEFMAERGIKEGDNLTENDLMEFAKLFLGVVDVNSKVFLGVGGWLMWIHGCLLQRFYNLTKEHPWKKVKDVPELMAAHNAIDEFERFVTLYLGFDYNKGAWIDRKDEGERFNNFGSNGLEVIDTNKKS